MEEFARYLPPLFVIALLAYLFWPLRRQPPAATTPVQVRRATVAQKHHDVLLQGGLSDGTGPSYQAASSYKVTFEILESREQVTFPVTLDQFAFLDQGVSGNLTSQGPRYLGFVADTPPQDPNGMESRDDEVTPSVKVLCEKCGRSSNFPLRQLGTVQQCMHCRAYVDVEPEKETGLDNTNVSK